MELTAKLESFFGQFTAQTEGQVEPGLMNDTDLAEYFNLVATELKPIAHACECQLRIMAELPYANSPQIRHLSDSFVAFFGRHPEFLKTTTQITAAAKSRDAARRDKIPNP